jgi:hypothetical protein
VDINLDLSKAPHPHFVGLASVLVAFMPGLFFEICLLLANPALVVSLMVPPLDRPIAIIVALIISFIVGNFFVIWSGLILALEHVLIRLFYEVFSPLRKKVLIYLLQAKGNPPRPSRFAKSRLLQNAHFKAWDDSYFQAIAHNWQRVAERMLNLYGIDLPAANDQKAWVSWSGILADFKNEDFRGHIMELATQATGWAGLSATLFAPRLRVAYFFTFCLVSIGISLSDGVRTGLNLASPERSWGLGLLRTFQELKRIAPVKEQGTSEETTKKPTSS